MLRGIVCNCELRRRTSATRSDRWRRVFRQLVFRRIILEIVEKQRCAQRSPRRCPLRFRTSVLSAVARTSVAQFSRIQLVEDRAANQFLVFVVHPHAIQQPRTQFVSKSFDEIAVRLACVPGTYPPTSSSNRRAASLSTSAEKDSRIAGSAGNGASVAIRHGKSRMGSRPIK